MNSVYNINIKNIFEAFYAIGRRGILLESMGSLIPSSRFSFIFTGDMIFQLKGDHLYYDNEKFNRETFFNSPEKILRSLGHDTEILTEKLEMLRKVLKTSVNERMFYGPAGLFSYDYGLKINGISSTHAQSVPDGIFILPDEIFVHDRLSELLYVVSSKENEEDIIKRLKKGAFAGEINTSSKHNAADMNGKSRAAFEITGKKDSVTRSEYMNMVEETKKYIRSGDIYQANISHSIKGKFAGNFLDVYKRLRSINPSPFMVFADFGTVKVASSSPERLMHISDNHITTRPIAGTYPRKSSEEDDRITEDKLRKDIKEIAEHIMLVDLERNDIARCSHTGTIKVDELFTVERYSHVMHLVSDIVGELKVSPFEAFSSMFPGGTITGCPKLRSMEIIDSIEKESRGFYTGSAGYFFPGRTDTNILIRSLFLYGNTITANAGAGIVADSNPEREYYETLHKAMAMIKSVSLGSTGFHGISSTETPVYRKNLLPSLYSRWSPPSNRKKHDAKVAVVDNRDSFTYNIADYFGMISSEVKVYSNIEDIGDDFTHLVISPGPGLPSSTGKSKQWIKEFFGKKPILGICLGHQLIVEYFGGTTQLAPKPIHGKISYISHDGKGLFKGVPDNFPAMRYHSLVSGEPIPDILEVNARTNDGLVMAVSHKYVPIFGLQFHPESIFTEHGMLLLENFLEF